MFLSEFTCEKCGCNKGRINDGNEIITIRCSSCKQINIVFDKTVSSTQNKQNVKSFVPKCPICSSPNIHKISIPKRAVRGAMFGLFSKTARSQWECKNCGNKW